MSNKEKLIKKSKQFSLAIELGQYQEHNSRLKVRKNRNLLPSIIPEQSVVNTCKQTDQKNPNLIQPANNIFNQRTSKLDINIISTLNPYQIIGIKEVKAYYLRMRKKNTTLAKRTQSGLSLSKISSTVRSQENINEYLSKEEVLSSLSPLQNTIQNNQTQHTEFAKRVSQRLQFYQKKWNTITNYKQINKFTSKKLFIKSKSSLLKKVDLFRQKMEQKQMQTLKQKSQNINEQIWKGSLRKNIQPKDFYKEKVILHILRDKISLKGVGKLKKQIDWINKKNNCMYTFIRHNINYSNNLSEKGQYFKRQNNSIR